MCHLLFVVYLLLSLRHYCEAVNDGGDITFPDELIIEDHFQNERGHDGLAEGQFGNSSLQIPLDIIRKINSYNVSDLLLNFVEGVQEDSPLLQDRLGDGIDARDAAIIPEFAGCKPELKIIELKQSSAPHIIYFPQCTRVERCGGCCSHILLSCQPKEIETVSFKVTKAEFVGRLQKFQFLNNEIIQVEKHTKCQCACTIKAKDCTKFQVYDEPLCTCICVNKDEQKKCYKTRDKLWNPKLCTCQCVDIKECSTGFLFDHNSCHCVPGIKRRSATTYKLRSKEEIDVVPLA